MAATVRALFLFCFCLCCLASRTCASNASWICYATGNNRGGSVDYDHCSPKNGTASNAEWEGYIGAAVAIVFFGSNFVPVKKFDTGDGFFFQWVLCAGIWMVGLIVNMIRYQPPLFIPSFLGGVLWTSANILTVSIIKMIGLTMGLTVWGATNLLSGWVSGMFILRQRESLTCPGINYGGVVLIIISTCLFALVKSSGKTVDTSPLPDPEKEERPLLDSSLNSRVIQNHNLVGKRDANISDLAVSVNDNDYSWVDNLGVWPRRILGFGLAMFVGMLYGIQFLPVQYLKLCSDSYHSCDDLDYLFGHYTGIFAASTLWFLGYSAFYRNKPRVYPKAIIPGLLSGIMWGIAMAGMFVANGSLSLAVSIPLGSAGPGFVSSAWGILVFREIKGVFSIVIYFVAFGISICGLIMNGLSRTTVHCH
ncbi:hypothetical protein EMCRGX_G033914 [Ephydatia muelleri]|eukprot:Em0022g332a